MSTTTTKPNSFTFTLDELSTIAQRFQSLTPIAREKAFFQCVDHLAQRCESIAHQATATLMSDHLPDDPKFYQTVATLDTRYCEHLR